LAVLTSRPALEAGKKEIAEPGEITLKSKRCQSPAALELQLPP